MIRIIKCHKCKDTKFLEIPDTTKDVTDALSVELDLMGWHRLGDCWLCDYCLEAEKGKWGKYE